MGLAINCTNLIDPLGHHNDYIQMSQVDLGLGDVELVFEGPVKDWN